MPCSDVGQTRGTPLLGPATPWNSPAPCRRRGRTRPAINDARGPGMKRLARGSKMESDGPREKA
eukprot:10731166-Lingulodinium_polyedra.AAC.1